MFPLRLALSCSLLCLVNAVTAQIAPADFAAAEALFRAKKTDEAHAAFSRLAAADPQHAGVQDYLGLVALRRDDPKTAIESFTRATELAPKASEYQRHLGDALGMAALRANVFAKAGLAKRCLRAYEKAVELDPTSVNARWSVMEFYKQAPGLLGGSMARAYAQAEEIRQLDAVGGRWAQALLLLKDEKAAAALALYDTDLTAEPPSYAALYQFGRLAQWSGQELVRGQQALEKCLTLPPGAWAGGHQEVHYALGRIHEARREVEAARTAYQAALKLDPQFRPALEALKKLG